MLDKAYRHAIFYFLLFSLLLLLSGALIFVEKIGWSIHDVIHYYLGDPNSFVVAKSFEGMAKIILPHIFAFGLFAMVLLHFIIFTKKRNTQEFRVLIYLTFLSAFFEIFSSLMIIEGFKLFAYIKLFTFFLFYLLVLYLLFILFKSIIYDK